MTKDLFYINEDIRQYEKVIIYGAGVAGRNMLFRLLQHNVQVECFADSYPPNCGTRFMNIPVVHIDELAAERESAAMVVCGRFVFEVAPELEKRGFKHLFFGYSNEGGMMYLERDGE